MTSSPYSPKFDEDPLRDDSPDVWNRLVEAIAPAAMLVSIRHRMSRHLLARMSPEDIWQETLLHVWRDRSRCEWRGLGAFRRWVLGVAENRIRNESDRAGTLKRGEGQIHRTLQSASASPHPPIVSSTTPSRVASYREESELMRSALVALPEELRDVVRLRHFEELPVEDVAQQLDIGVSAVKHRFRKGAALYHEHIQQLLATNRRFDSPEESGGDD